MTADAVDRRMGPDEFHWWRARAACATAPMWMVDEAYRRTGGDVADEFRKQFCDHCPVRQECLDEAMATGEWGVWGGQSLHLRTKNGGQPPRVRKSA
jgi:hypothetical protein